MCKICRKKSVAPVNELNQEYASARRGLSKREHPIVVFDVMVSPPLLTFAQTPNVSLSLEIAIRRFKAFMSFSYKSTMK